jgi:hypothetical protein
MAGALEQGGPPRFPGGDAGLKTESGNNDVPGPDAAALSARPCIRSSWPGWISCASFGGAPACGGLVQHENYALRRFAGIEVGLELVEKRLDIPRRLICLTVRYLADLLKRQAERQFAG